MSSLPMVIPNDTYIQGQLSAQTFVCPAGSITNAGVNASAAIAATKTINRHVKTYVQNLGSAVVAATAPLYVCKSANGATINKVWLSCNGIIATGADRTVTLDVKYTYSGGSPTTCLSATIGLTNASTLYAITNATLAFTAMLQDYQLIAYVTVAGAAGNQAQGFICGVEIDEMP